MCSWDASHVSTYDAKAKLSEILRRVRAGQRVGIRDHGELAAEVTPVERARGGLKERPQRLEKEGVIAPARAGKPAIPRLARRPGEPGAARLQKRIGRFDGLYSSNLAEAEIRSTLVRENVDVPDPGRAFASVAWVLPDRTLSAEIGRVLAAGRLRGADLWHLACALYLEPEPDELVFLTLDPPQRTAASRLGFSV